MSTSALAADSAVPVLTCRDLSARYGRIVVTRDVSFDVRGGEVLAILGPNGAGKTSLLSSIAGLVRSSGHVILDGQRIDGLPAHTRARRGLAYVPEGRALFADMSVRENLAQGLRLADDPEAGHDLALEMFPRLDERMNQIAGMLSGGEQQMLAIARAIVGQPRLLILDEPTQGLAPQVHKILVDGISHLRALGLGVLLVEQNHAFARLVADRFILIRSGEKVGEGSGEQLDNRDAIKAMYLGLDASTQRTAVDSE
jgi:branched-chain amino acid transport system ATP-binding protein